MTLLQNTTHQPKRERSMKPLLQTSAHYPETSKQNDRSLSDGSLGTLSISPIQEPADRAKTSLSAMTQGTDADQSSMPPSNDRGSKKRTAPQGHDRESTAITTLGIIIAMILTLTKVQKNKGQHKVTNQAADKALTDHATPQTTQYIKCPGCRHKILEGPLYKGPPGNVTSSS